MRFISAIFVICALALIAAPRANAQNQDPILALPDGQVILSISATARKDVEQDMLVANMSIIITDRSASETQNQINTIMARALKEAKKAADVKVNTGAYRVYETTIARTKETQWRGQQSLTLKSMKSEELLSLVQKLQKMGLTMNGLSYILSPENATKVQDGLMEEALNELQERANRAAKALGKSTAELRDVNVSSSGIPYQPMMRSEMMSMAKSVSAMAAPVAAAGEATISMSVNARAILKP